jgi:hypothetical protein
VLSIGSGRLIAVGFAAAMLAGGSLAGRTLARPTPAGEGRAGLEHAEPTTTVYLARRKWHIDVGFAAADLGPLAPVSAEFPAAKYVFFGFGDRHYFLAKNHNAPIFLGALWPGPALILVTSLQGAPAQAFGEAQVIELGLSTAQARAIQSFIRSSIADPAPYANGPYEGSLYYAARQRYSALHTCNTWAAEALRAGDVPVRAGGVVFASQLWRQVRKLGGTRVPAPGVPALPSPAPESP